jgi:two-component system chemotaxis response regulator CheY
MRRIVRSLLAAIGITHVLEAVNGQEALDLLVGAEGAAIDLIICDLNMPQMDGLAFCNQLRRTEQLRARHLPVLILTAERDEMLLEVVRQVGAAGVAHKPISAPELRNHMQHLLGFAIG